MKPTLQILALIGLALTCAAIVLVVNAPKWFDATTMPATRTSER
jgi:hypothetical protein